MKKRLKSPVLMHSMIEFKVMRRDVIGQVTVALRVSHEEELMLVVAESRQCWVVRAVGFAQTFVGEIGDVKAKGVGDLFIGRSVAAKVPAKL